VTYNWLLSWNKNFRRKIKNGTFDMEKAKTVVRMYLVPTVISTRRR
jgi:mRNA-degrading endonuclease YafQ of YafQ-DinJ toxin-antitoxin module